MRYRAGVAFKTVYDLLQNLDRVRDRVAQQKLLDEIVEELRRSTYVDIRTS